MSARVCPPNRVHLIAHAGAPRKDIARFGFADADAYFAFIRQHLPAPLRLTFLRRCFEVEENEPRGGRHDDAARVRDLQNALDDPRTMAIVSASGGAYFTRILPHLDFSVLAGRATPLWALGFSEMTTLVNLVASYRGGRGLYWLCPNYLAWRVRPAERARVAFAEFWRGLPTVLGLPSPAQSSRSEGDSIWGELACGTARSGCVRLIGGCLSVLAAALTGPPMRRLRSHGRWLLIEDINETPCRIDRHLAALKIAGWFDRVAGVLVGDFHTQQVDQIWSVVEILKLHLPRERRLPIVTTHSVGHVRPMTPVELNRPLEMTVRGRDVTIAASVTK
jgi:muramoyltetrapeptide carboxypeptidase